MSNWARNWVVAASNLNSKLWKHYTFFIMVLLDDKHNLHKKPGAKDAILRSVKAEKVVICGRNHF